MADESREPKVSVIMPAYNRAALIGRAIESVLTQPMDDLELIVVDDGSTDGTRQALSDYQDERLHVLFFEQNRGIGAARHAGVSLAVGEWVAFLDADDRWLPEKLALDLSALQRHPEIDLLFDNYRNINYLDGIEQLGFDQTSYAFDHLRTTELEPGIFRIDSGLAESLLTANLIGTASIITIRRAVFEKIGNFNPNLSGPEDFELLWRAVLAGVCFAYQTRVLVERHKDKSSITARTRSFVPHLLEAYDLCESNIRQYGKLDLLPALNRSRLHAWQSLIRANALDGRRWHAWTAYRKSLHYGFSKKAFLYLLAAMAGPHAIQHAKHYRSSRSS